MGLIKDLRPKALRLSDTVEFRYRRRYGLPATDPRFLRCTIEDIVLDLMAHRFCDDPRSRDEMVTDDFDADLVEFERDAAAAAAAAEPPVDLPDDWEEVT
jgi:hypothetical protein